MVGDKLLCTNFCCFEKEDKEPVLLYAKDITSKINPTALLTTPKEDHFILTIVINPFAANPFDLPLAAEIELYIYDAIYEGLRKRSSSTTESTGQPAAAKTQMQKFEEGKVFPWKQYTHLGEVTVPVFNENSFDVVVSFVDPTPEEVKIFRKGEMEIGLFIYKDTPFLYVDFRKFSIDFALNINKIKNQDDIDNWLNAEANVIHLYFIDGKTGILMAQRMISVNFLENIRDTLETQTEQTASETDAIIDELSRKYTTDQIQKQAIKRMVFK